MLNRTILYGKDEIELEPADGPIWVIQSKKHCRLIDDQVDVKKYQNQFNNQQIPLYYLKLIDPQKSGSQTGEDLISGIDDTLVASKKHVKSFNEISDSLEKLNLLLSVVDLWETREELNNELDWAYYEEKKSKSSLFKDRYEELADEIKNIRSIINRTLPNYEFIQKRYQKLKKQQADAQKDIKKLNKAYMTKTGQVNQLSREIDGISSKYEIYKKKLTELDFPTDQESKIEQEKDYRRIKNKADNQLKKMEEKKSEKSVLKSEIKTIRSRIAKYKKSMKSSKRELKSITPRFKEQSNNLEALQNKLSKKEEQYKKLQMDLFSTDSEDSNITKPEGSQPTMVRFSENIKADIESINEQIEILAEQIDGLSSHLSIEEIASLIKKFQKKIGGLIAGDKLPQQDRMLNMFHEFNTELQEVYKNIAKLLGNSGLRLNFPILPLKKKKTGSDGDLSVLNVGVDFFVEQNGKTVRFQELLNREKLLIGLVFEITFKVQVNMEYVLVSDEIFESRWLSKPNIEYIIHYLRENIIEKPEYSKIHVVIDIQKEKFKQDELENIKLINI